MPAPASIISASPPLLLCFFVLRHRDRPEPPPPLAVPLVPLVDEDEEEDEVRLSQKRLARVSDSTSTIASPLESRRLDGLLLLSCFFFFFFFSLWSSSLPSSRNTRGTWWL